MQGLSAVHSSSVPQMDWLTDRLRMPHACLLLNRHRGASSKYGCAGASTDRPWITLDSGSDGARQSGQRQGDAHANRAPRQVRASVRPLIRRSASRDACRCQAIARRPAMVDAVGAHEPQPSAFALRFGRSPRTDPCRRPPGRGGGRFVPFRQASSGVVGRSGRPRAAPAGIATACAGADFSRDRPCGFAAQRKIRPARRPR
jgi:hypothetical protein